ncbi:MAG: S9 family peptidase, partial [Caulobacter sp.]|nr:S9 family peptidase [Caulobacter sp.]
LSPTGDLLAVSITNGEERTLLIRESKEGGKVVRALKLGTTKFADMQWAGDNHLIVTLATTAGVIGLKGGKREWWQAFDIDIATGKQKQVFKGDTSSPNAESMNVILDRPMIRIIEGEPTVFVEGLRFDPDGVGSDTLYKINLKSGFSRAQDFGGDSLADEWLVNAKGEPMAQSVYDQKTGLWRLKLRRDRGWVTVEQETLPMGSRGLAGIGRDGVSTLIATDSEDPKEDRLILREYAPDGTKTDVPGSADFNSPIFAPDTHALIGGVTLVGDETRYTFFDAKLQASWKSVLKAFPGSHVYLESWSDDRRKFVVMLDSPTTGMSYVFVDLDAKAARWLTDSYRDLPESGLSEVKSITYKAADGLDIPAYLTLPYGKDPKNLPLVVLPHGGPAVRDTPGFDWWAQAIASRGYAVLQPQYRGSAGYGWDFKAKGFGQWGKAMQTDLSDGVRFLAKQGAIDPKRVCIVGGSYGGYAALAGAAIDKGVYRCAVSVAGVSDLKAMLQSEADSLNGSRNAPTRYWLRFMGADGVKDPDLTAISPAKLADRIEIPVMLIHGKDDTIVPFKQSTLMADAMKKAGKPYELIALEGEDHNLARGATRLQMLTATIGFLEKNNPPN